MVRAIELAAPPPQQVGQLETCPIQAPCLPGTEKKCEECFANGNDTIEYIWKFVNRGIEYETRYEIDLRTMLQKNLETNATHRIIRLETKSSHAMTSPFNGI